MHYVQSSVDISRCKLCVKLVYGTEKKRTVCWACWMGWVRRDLRNIIDCDIGTWMKWWTECTPFCCHCMPHSTRTASCAMVVFISCVLFLEIIFLPSSPFVMAILYKLHSRHCHLQASMIWLLLGLWTIQCSKSRTFGILDQLTWVCAIICTCIHVCVYYFLVWTTGRWDMLCTSVEVKFKR